jgi:hypothetical protein
MSISSITSSPFPYQLSPTTLQNSRQQWQQDFQSLGKALQSGDLSGAQEAFQALQQLRSNAPMLQTGQTGQAKSSSNPLSADVSALGSALQSGDLSGAQAAFSKLQQDMQALGATHHRHHHHHASSATQTDATQSGLVTGVGSAAPDATGTGSTAGSNVNLTV